MLVIVCAWLGMGKSNLLNGIVYGCCNEWETVSEVLYCFGLVRATSMYV